MTLPYTATYTVQDEFVEANWISSNKRLHKT